MPFCTYVLVNDRNETYVGQTEDLARRVAEHNGMRLSDTLHTKRHGGPWFVLYSQEYPTRSEAMKRERQLKSGGGRQFIRQLVTPRASKTGGC